MHKGRPLSAGLKMMLQCELDPSRNAPGAALRPRGVTPLRVWLRQERFMPPLTLPPPIGKLFRHY